MVGSGVTGCDLVRVRNIEKYWIWIVLVCLGPYGVSFFNRFLASTAGSLQAIIGYKSSQVLFFKTI